MSESSLITASVGWIVLVSLLGHTRPMNLPGGDISTAYMKQSVRAEVIFQQHTWNKAWGLRWYFNSIHETKREGSGAIWPRGGELDGKVVKSPPLSPTPSGGGRWGTSLIGALYSDHQRDWLKVWEGELEYRKIATFHGIGVSTATKEGCCSLFYWQAQNVGSRLAGVDEEEKPHHPNSILLTAKSKFVMLWNKNSLEHENVESWSWRSGNVSLQCDIFEQDYSQTFLAPSEGSAILCIGWKVHCSFCGQLLKSTPSSLDRSFILLVQMGPSLVC